MGLPDGRDPHGFKKRVGSMDADRLAAAVQQGGLSSVAEKAAMAELAGRVIADERSDDSARARSRMAWVVDRAPALAAAVVFAVWLARTFGLFR
jgi:hypothetical protein